MHTIFGVHSESEGRQQGRTLIDGNTGNKSCNHKKRHPIDNNACENAIRPFVIGRKNWLFSQSVKGAEASATIYSMIETARLNGHEPYRYLRHVLMEVAKGNANYETLLPYNLNASTTSDLPVG